MCLGEIVSAVGFLAETTYIEYSISMPKGWSFEEYNMFENSGMMRDEECEMNKATSCTQQSRGRTELTDDCDEIEGTQYVSNFGFPLDF